MKKISKKKTQNNFLFIYLFFIYSRLQNLATSSELKCSAQLNFQVHYLRHFGLLEKKTPKNKKKKQNKKTKQKTKTNNKLS